MKNILLLLLLAIFFLTNCANDEDPPIGSDTQSLTIFFVNDQHGQIDNFSKIKYIVDMEEESTNVIVACSGDMFSGNPVVDNYPEKGYPMIDLMNEAGFDISVIGNHEFDYGQTNLTAIMEQANFDWVCANVDMGSTGIPEPLEYKTMSIGGLKVTFLGLVETNGKQDATIPSTHPLKIEGISFERPEDVITDYATIKEQEDSDLYIALTHLGFNYSYALGDYQLASLYPYFDLIIGGHSHQTLYETVNNIPIFQSGSYLNYLGKIKLTVKEKQVESVSWDLIDLNAYAEYDATLQAAIDEYNDLPLLNDVIGFSHIYHDKSLVGCFYTDALRGAMNVDISFQNTGGVRSDLDQGDIIKREIFEISPFNNGTLIYSMTVTEIKSFLIGSASGFYYSGVSIIKMGSDIIIKDLAGAIIPDNTVLTVGINDYIPAVYESYFPANGVLQTLSAAETLISYLENINSEVNYPVCDRYFRYE